ncbi:MAG: HAD family phosphatase [bacterium]|nr:HAD family phosphatase [bacterium]MDD5756413.1 HAD family phosphatase [bacterium]
MKYKIVVFDMDGTLTRHVSSWQLIHEKLGMWDEDACRYQEQFLQGRISYRRFCELDAQRWKGVPAAVVVRHLLAIPYSRSVRQTLKKLKTLGFKLAIISTGLDLLALKVKKDLQIDHCLCNKLSVRHGRLTGQVKIDVAHGEKGKAFKRLLKKAGLKPEQAIFVGDSATDVPAARIAGYAIAFNASHSELAELADHNCSTKDFREVFAAITKANRSDD